MNKKILQILIFSTACLIFLISAHSQEDMQLVSADAFVKPRRPPVVFRHDEHNELAEIEECNECHHVYEDGEKMEDESSEDLSCSECHEEKSSGRMPGLRKAFHMNCIIL